ncbi:hypothetical protein Aca07nite_69330 [Actinoplanes capillaceus]|uniref:Uncharacterized protein n=1 Tax=Actinoplanes campanulatus TaxID=113559 RepID=A0ABQ3WTY6_9ACTN|nr:hypothetical protein [Actinoplanes capillaceus]GID49658.1 hypothetical protein Aca07nite_69330 [Actinoplanes capillaceus]
MPGSFHVFEFQDRDPPLVSMENAGGVLFAETDSEIACFPTPRRRGLTAQMFEQEARLG